MDDKFNYLETIVQEKTKSYAFIAHRRRGFTHQNSIVTYDDVNLNAAGAVNAGTGIFTAPVKGIYFVSFLGLKEQQSDNRKYYQLDVEMDGFGLDVYLPDQRFGNCNKNQIARHVRYSGLKIINSN